MKKWILIATVIITLNYNHAYGLLILRDGDVPQSLVVKIAQSEQERIKGLSDTRFLIPGFGMLFMFDSEQRAGIWMKEMNFPIDIFWFKKDLSADHILKDVKPETYPNVFYSQGDVLYVLETRVGELSLENADVLDNPLDLDLTYINNHDKNIINLWQILQPLLFHLR